MMRIVMHAMQLPPVHVQELCMCGISKTWSLLTLC